MQNLSLVEMANANNSYLEISFCVWQNKQGVSFTDANGNKVNICNETMHAKAFITDRIIPAMIELENNGNIFTLISVSKNRYADEYTAKYVESSFVETYFKFTKPKVYESIWQVEKRKSILAEIIKVAQAEITELNSVIKANNICCSKRKTKEALYRKKELLKTDYTKANDEFWKAKDELDNKFTALNSLNNN